MKYLDAIFDSRKSFYNKAVVEWGENEIRLYSYNTFVMRYDTLKQEFTEQFYAPHSQTTNRHIKEFKLQVEAGYIK